MIFPNQEFDAKIDYLEHQLTMQRAAANATFARLLALRGDRLASQCVGKTQAQIAKLIEDFHRSTQAFQQPADNYSVTPARKVR